MCIDYVKRFIDACWNRNVAVVDEMINNGFVPVPLFDGEPSPLIIAIEEGFFDIAEIILKSKVDVNYKDDMGTTALQAAACCGNEKLVQALLKKGAINQKDFTERSASDYARIKGFNRIAEEIDTFPYDLNSVGNGIFVRARKAIGMICYGKHVKDYN